MKHSKRRLVLIWLATTAAVALAAVFAYNSLVPGTDLNGRTDPEKVLSDPGSLFEDPGMIGSAVEISVTRAIATCMEARGFEYREPAWIEGLDDSLDPATDGYGIATGPSGGEVSLGDGGADPSSRTEYEQALYGAVLDDGTTTGGCAAVGAAEFQQALATIAAMPYSIEEFEADARAHPAMVAGLGKWSDCMARKGHDYADPDEILAALSTRLESATPTEARALVEEERRLAADDFACRDEHLAPAEAAVAADLGPSFVEANRDQLEDLMPPEPVSSGMVTVPTDLGSGDVQVTLLWTASVDLDLSVTDPDGYTINYGNRTAPNGGQLDRDANQNCLGIVPDPVENVFWPEGEAPSGDYLVIVELYRTCADGLPIDFTLIVQVDGRAVVNERVEMDGYNWSTEFRY